MLYIAFAPNYVYQLPENHRFPMEKYELLPEQLLYEGTVTTDQFFEPDALSDEELLLVHTPSYWMKLKSLRLSRKEERRIGFPVRQDLVARGRHIAHGTYECALYALTYGVSCNIAGGTHHAYPNHGEGFCVFNDIAIASTLLLRRRKAKRILIVDLDVHQGNGNAFIFRNESRVFTFSMHGDKNYPVRKEQSDLDIPLADKTNGRRYLSLLYDNLSRVIDIHEPDLIFFQSGVDVLEEDKLGRLSLTIKDCKRRDQIVFTKAKENRIPIVAVMGGGYSPKLSTIIEAHANTFRVAQELYF